MGFIPGMQSTLTSKNQCNTSHISRIKSNDHLDPEKALFKIQHTFMIKTLNKLGVEGLPQLDKEHLWKIH